MGPPAVVDVGKSETTLPRLTSARPDQTSHERRDSLASIFLRFVKFGGLAWGGPAAQIAMIKRECVDGEGWAAPETFTKTLAVYQVLPGPEAHELCVYFGRLRGGKIGGFLAGLGFMLPGFLLMFGLSILYFEADLADNLDELFYGLTAAVGAVVARAVLRLRSAFVTDVPLAVIALSASALTLWAGVGFALVLVGAGLAYELWQNGRRLMGKLGSVSLAPVALAGALVGGVTLSLTGEIFWEGLKAGLVTFGGAFTVIPYLQDAAVGGQGWLTEEQFVDGSRWAASSPLPSSSFRPSSATPRAA